MTTPNVGTHAVGTHAVGTHAVGTHAVGTHAAERFPLKKHSSQESIQEISSVTNGKINLQYIAVMMQTIENRKHTWSSFLEGPLESDIIKQIIGKDGLHLKIFTTKYGLDLIWYDRASNRFLLWGPKVSLISALHALKRQINRFIIKYEQHTAAVNCLDQTMNIVRLRSDDNECDVEQPKQKKLKRN